MSLSKEIVIFLLFLLTTRCMINLTSCRQNTPTKSTSLGHITFNIQISDFYFFLSILSVFLNSQPRVDDKFCFNLHSQRVSLLLNTLVLSQRIPLERTRRARLKQTCIPSKLICLMKKFSVFRHPILVTELAPPSWNPWLNPRSDPQNSSLFTKQKEILK